MRLLVADDEVNLAKALQAVLEDVGYNCDVCFDGNSAIRLISQEIYDGLILDIMMPEKNGYEVLNQIRKQKNDIPVLLLSALNEVDDKVTGLDGLGEKNLDESIEQATQVLEAGDPTEGEIMEQMEANGELEKPIDLSGIEVVD